MTAGSLAVLLAAALAAAMPAAAGEPFDGRWAGDARGCGSESAAPSFVVVDALSLQWREATCVVRTSYRVRAGLAHRRALLGRRRRQQRSHHAADARRTARARLGRRAGGRTAAMPMSTAAKPGHGGAEVAATPGSGVQTAKVSADEAGMRVDRFLEARFPGLSFSHIQRIIRKGELRVNGKRAQAKQRLEAGQAVRIPPLRLEQGEAARGRERGRGQDPRFPQIHHALRRRRRAGAQQAHGAGGAGRLRHHAPSRRHARRAARRARPAPAPGAPARQGYRRLPAGGEDPVRRLGARQDLPLAFGAQDLLGAGRGRAQAAPGPHLHLPGQGGARGRIRSCASRATARRARATP